MITKLTGGGIQFDRLERGPRACPWHEQGAADRASVRSVPASTSSPASAMVRLCRCHKRYCSACLGTPIECCRRICSGLRSEWASVCRVSRDYDRCHPPERRIKKWRRAWKREVIERHISTMERSLQRAGVTALALGPRFRGNDDQGGFVYANLRNQVLGPREEYGGSNQTSRLRIGSGGGNNLAGEAMVATNAISSEDSALTAGERLDRLPRAWYRVLDATKSDGR